MYKYFSLVLLLIVLNWKGQAQNFIGPMMGVNFATWSALEEPDEVTTGFKTGINIGAAFETAINLHFSIQPELRFTQMGTIQNFDLGFIKEKVTVGINYITIPVLLKYKFGSNQSQFFILTGPRLGFGIGKIILESGGQSDSITFDEAEVTKFDFGFELGAGVSFKLGKANMFIDTRYYLGLQKLNSGDQPGNAKNAAIGINLGYLFPIGSSK